jgi:hypothetical protein
LPRFYFHVSTIDAAFPDEEGVELADLAAAHACALRIMHRTMLSDPEEQNWRGWMIKIADAKSRTLLTLLYPARKPIRREPFGLRTGFSRVPLLCCAACMVLLGLASNPLEAGAARSEHRRVAEASRVFDEVSSNGTRHHRLRARRKAHVHVYPRA